MDFISFCELIFSAAFVSGIILVFLGAAFCLVHFVIFPLIRLFLPTFATRPVVEIVRGDAQADHKEVKRLAIDFAIQEKIRQQRNLKRRMEELMSPHLVVGKAKVDRLFDIEGVMPAEVRPSTNLAISRLHQPDDLWCLARYPNGFDKPAHYLCFKTSTKDRGLRTAFAALPDRACKMDLTSAMRWRSVLGAETFVTPANSAARLKMKSQRQEASNGQVAEQATQ